MSNILWLSEQDVLATGICEIAESVELVEKVLRLFEQKQALIIEESAMRLNGDGLDQACYCLPAYVGGEFHVCGVKWTSHGHALKDEDGGKSRIQAAIVINDASGGKPICMMNGTAIGAARTGAVTAAALRRLAPEYAKKAALLGAGGQAEHQLQALLYACPELSEIAVWSRGGEKNQRLVARYQPKTETLLTAAKTLDAAVEGADIIIAATSAPEPYLEPQHLEAASVYCHIGFHEITHAAIERFSDIVVDTWQEAKDVSGQSLFRYYREGLVGLERISSTLGALLLGTKTIPRASRDHKVMFDAFGLPIFDISFAKIACERAKKLQLGTNVAW